MPTDTTPTTIPVPTYVRKMLDRCRSAEAPTYADVILRFIDEVPSRRLLAEIERIRREERPIPLEELEKDPGFY